MKFNKDPIYYPDRPNELNIPIALQTKLEICLVIKQSMMLIVH